jgi:hypothetical protein
VKRLFITLCLIVVSTQATAGPVNESINAYNLTALQTIYRLNYASLAGDQTAFANWSVEDATIQGLNDLDSGKNIRPLSIENMKLMLSKCLIDGVSFITSNKVSMVMRCVGNQNALVDYDLVGEETFRISKIEFMFGAAPRININNEISDR